jgi:hypothetical protein
MVSVASEVITQSRNSGPEATVLRLGCEALDKVYDQLDEAGAELHHFLKRAVATGGTS